MVKKHSPQLPFSGFGSSTWPFKKALVRPVVKGMPLQRALGAVNSRRFHLTIFSRAIWAFPPEFTSGSVVFWSFFFDSLKCEQRI